jgi:hypothetical protein
VNTQELPAPTPSLNTVELRQRLACLIDPQEAKEAWFHQNARPLAIQFCAALPAVFGDSLDRMTLWDKIASAIQSGYAKTVSGDLDLFTQHVLESIKAEPGKAVANERFTSAIDALSVLRETERQDWLTYLVTHLVPVLVQARRAHKEAIGANQ